MISLQEFSEFLNHLMKPQSFKDYCFNGLQIEGKNEIQSIATAVSASLETIEQAVEMGVDALIVHHGMFWKGDCYSITGSKKKKLEKLLSNGINLFAYHLPLDAHEQLGNNWKAALDLNWKNLKGFSNLGNATYLGVQGEFEPQSFKTWIKNIEGYYGHEAHVAAGGKETVSSAALISGGAHKQIIEAIDAGVDCFITGSFDEPIWHIAREEGIHFAALGHSATERVGPIALGEYLESELNVTWNFLDLPNPF